MPQRHHKTLLEWIKVYGPVTALVIVGFLFAYQFVDPAPPKRLVISTGSADGAYTRHAQRYAEFLAARGIELEIRPSAGSIENLQRLADHEVDVGFVQGGTTDGFHDRGLYALGSLYYEPAWLFVRSQAPETLGALRGKRLAIGSVGSGTRALALTLLQDNQLGNEDLDLLELSGRAAADALRAGKVDALFLVVGPNSPLVRELLAAEDITLMNFRRAGAYARLHGYLSELVLPEGMIDLLANVPPQRVQLLAASANLVVHEDVHPALLDLLLQAADQVHSPGGWFEAPERFPADDLLVLPLSDEAKRYYRYGPPLLQRYLPFWAASMIDRLKVMLLPLVVILLPLMKIMPPIYSWRMRAKIYRWYKELEVVETAARDGADTDRLRTELARIGDEVARVHVPLSFASQAYDLRMHLDLVRQTLERRQ